MTRRRVVLALSGLAAAGLALWLATAYFLPGRITVERTALLALLQKGQFEQLDSTLEGLQQSLDEGRIPETTVARAFDAFRTSDPIVTDQLGKWVEIQPESRAAKFARAINRHHLTRISLDLNEHVRRQDQIRDRVVKLQSDLAIELTKAMANGRETSIGIMAAYENAGLGRRMVPQIGLLELLKEQGKASGLIQRAYARNLEPWFSVDSRDWDSAMGKLKKFLEETEARYGESPDFDWIDGYFASVQGELLLRRGALPAALAAYGNAIAAAKRPEYFRGRARVHALAGDREAAIADLDQALALEPEDADAFCRRSQQLRLQGDLERALEDAGKAVALDPLNPEYLITRASILTLLHRDREAQADAESALKFGDQFPWVQYWVSYLFRDSDPQRSQVAYTRAMMLSESQGDKFDLPRFNKGS